MSGSNDNVSSGCAADEPTRPVPLKRSRDVTAVCDPPSYWIIETHAERIEISNISFTNVNPQWPWCAYISQEDVIQAAKDEIWSKCNKEYKKECSGCEQFALADFLKTRVFRDHVLPQTELEFSFAGVSITRSEGGFYGLSQERIELTGA